MTRDAVLCMACGYNLNTGQYIDLPNKLARKKSEGKFKPFSLLVSIGLTAFILTGVAVYVFYEPILEGNRSALPSGIREKLPIRLERPFYPAWMKNMTHDALVAVYEQDIETKLLTSHPAYVNGDTITLKSQSGKAGQGIFRGTEEQHALLEAKGNLVRVPFSTLEENCRLRADSTGRKVYIFKMANRRAKALLK